MTRAAIRGAAVPVLLLLLVLSGAAAEDPGELSLENGWIFQKGDDPSWAAAPPASATPMKIGSAWENEGLPGYDGFGWYFLRFETPVAMRNEACVLELGKIDDADEVYLNGVRIGASGGMPPNFSSKWSSPRSYALAAGALQAVNLLAVRVFDNGGGGGLYSGRPRLLTRSAWEQSMRERYQPHRSFHEIPFANGLTSAKVNLRRNCIDSFREHIYSQYDEHTKTRDFGRELRFGAGGTAPEMKDASYINGTGIVKWTVESGGRRAECYAFAPMDSEKKKIYLLVRKGPDWRGPLAFTAAMEISGGDEIRIKDRVIAQKAPGGEDFIAFKAFNDLGPVEGAYADGVITIAETADPTEWIALSVTYSKGGADLEPENVPPAHLLESEKAWWAAWHRTEKTPVFANADEAALFRQSTAILKMAQCREAGSAYGQVLASLPPGHWNICWIRDGAYAVNGLVLANHLQEAKDALTFFLEADCGKYVNFPIGGIDYGVGVPYQISVCRYFGNGEEESDGGHDPNIELDGFGLFLWALERYVAASGDISFVEKYSDQIFRLTADVIIHCIEPERRVLKPESGPWERHLIDNGYNGARRFSYSSATAYQGLNSAARLAALLGRETEVKKYLAAASALKQGFHETFVTHPCNCVKGLAEETEIERYLDAGAVEAINFDVVDSQVALQTLAVFDRYLKKEWTPGYARNDDGGDYDVAEWIVIDLRIASAFSKLGRRDRSERLIDWVTAQSNRNFNIIAELYSVGGSDYEGAVPMCGFGPGAYIAALFDRPPS